jgi:hypothetical protein
MFRLLLLSSVRLHFLACETMYLFNASPSLGRGLFQEYLTPGDQKNGAVSVRGVLERRYMITAAECEASQMKGPGVPQAPPSR